MNPIPEFLRLVKQQQVKQQQRPLAEAVLLVFRARRDLCLRVMDWIGSWPSSEPELRTLQRMM